MAPDEDYGFAETEARTGAYVIGANTYREMGGSGGAVPTYVVTHDATLAKGRNVRPYAGDLRQLIETVRSDIAPDKDICVFGGGRLVSRLLEFGLIDEGAASEDEKLRHWVSLVRSVRRGLWARLRWET